MSLMLSITKNQQIISQEVVLEVGAHLGHCTRVLSRLFRSVVALEHSPHVLKKNAERNDDLNNVVPWMESVCNIL